MKTNFNKRVIAVLLLALMLVWMIPVYGTESEDASDPIDCVIKTAKEIAKGGNPEIGDGQGKIVPGKIYNKGLVDGMARFGVNNRNAGANATTSDRLIIEVDNIALKDYPYCVIVYKTNINTANINLNMTTVDGTYTTAETKLFATQSRTVGELASATYSWNGKYGDSVKATSVFVPIYSTDRPAMSVDEYMDIQYLGFFKNADDAEAFDYEDYLADLPEDDTSNDDDASIFTIYAEDVTVDKGTEKVDVNISFANNPGVNRLGFYVYYDRTVMSYSGAKNSGEIFDYMEFTLGEGYIYVSAFSAQNISANGKFVTLTLNLLYGTTAGDYEINIVKDESNSGGVLNQDFRDVEYAVKPGKVTVSGSDDFIEDDPTFGDDIDDGIYIATPTDLIQKSEPKNMSFETIHDNGKTYLRATMIESEKACAINWIIPKSLDSDKTKYFVIKYRTNVKTDNYGLSVEVCRNYVFNWQAAYFRIDCENYPDRVEITTDTKVIDLTGKVAATGVPAIKYFKILPWATIDVDFVDESTVGWFDIEYVAFFEKEEDIESFDYDEYLESHPLATSTVKFLDKDGEEISSNVYTVGNKVTLPTAAKIEKYEFLGWSDGVSEELITEDFIVFADTTLTARYASGSIPGDVNGDSKVTRPDLIRLTQYFANWDVEIDEVGADTNGDGKITRPDLIRLTQYFANWDVILGK